MTAKTLTLHGLDAQNPLGFLAALGLLRIVDDHARRQELAAPRLAFVEAGSFVAQLESPFDFPSLTELILLDAREQAESMALQLAYDSNGLVDKEASDATRDLKPPPAAARRFLADAAVASRRDADLAAGFFSELVQAGKGDTKPTGLHFTAGQQAFLAMVEELRTGCSAADIEEALAGPWRNQSRLPSLSWDASAARNYALRATNPSGEKRGSITAANWLGVHALAYFPVYAEVSRAGQKVRLKTTGIEGGWTDSKLTWPLWSAMADVRTVLALLRCDSTAWSQAEREALGVSVVLRAEIRRTDQGGYGSFLPASVLPPALSRARFRRAKSK